MELSGYFFKVKMVAVVLGLMMVAHGEDPTPFRYANNSGSTPHISSSQINALSNVNSSYDLPSEQMPFIGDFSIVDSLYLVGPGDVFQIFFETSAMERQVNPEGNILLNRMGTFHLDGMTLKEAKKLLVEKMQINYKKTECFVNLCRPKTMWIFFTGGVGYPSSYQIFGNFRLIEGIEKAMGFSPFAQRGMIRITSKNGAIKTVNPIKFFTTGDLSSNPYLSQGDIIDVPLLDFKKPWVNVSYDTTFLTIQMESAETVGDILNKFFSFKVKPAYTSVRIIEKNGKTDLLTLDQVNKYQPSPEAKIEILDHKDRVFVGGAVARGGFQPYQANLSLIQYVSAAGIISTSRMSSKMRIVRVDGREEMVAMESKEIYPGDVIYVKQSVEQKIFGYTPILLSVASLTIALISILSR